MNQEGILSLVDSFYDAALDEQGWPTALQQLSWAFGGVGTSMLSVAATPPLLCISPALEDAVKSYKAGWWQKDAFLNHAKKNCFGPGIHIDTDHFSDEFKARNEFYQEFLRPQGASGIISVATSPFAGALISINVQRRTGTGVPQPSERRLFALVARHLSRAAAMHLRLTTSEAVSHGLASRLSDFDCAVAVVNRDGKLLLCNAGFDKLRHEGIEVRQGRVVLARTDMQAVLQKLVWSALDGTLGKSGPDTLAVCRPHSLLPLLIRAVPITPARAERHLGSIPVRAVMLMVLNPSHSAYPELTTALQALGLTPAQARVALAIGSGQSPKEAAEALQVTEATVRTTVKHLYSRLGIDRQSQLARLVARAIPFST